MPGYGDMETWGPVVPNSADPRYDSLAEDTALEDVEDDLYEKQQERKQLVEDYLDGKVSVITYLKKAGTLDDEIKDILDKKLRILSGEDIF